MWVPSTRACLSCVIQLKVNCMLTLMVSDLATVYTHSYHAIHDQLSTQLNSWVRSDLAIYYTTHVTHTIQGQLLTLPWILSSQFTKACYPIINIVCGSTFVMVHRHTVPFLRKARLCVHVPSGCYCDLIPGCWVHLCGG